MLLDFQTISLVVVIFWLFFITILVWRLRAGFSTAFNGTKNHQVIQVLEKLIRDHEIAGKEIASLSLRLNKLEQNSLSHIQRIGLLRFNPFSDMGGEQSFVLALLDEHRSGIIISGLYARTGIRWYTKRIVKGSGADQELTTEEKKAIESAK